MDWAAAYQDKRAHYWPQVENFFGGLPPQLLRQGMLLKNNLATFYTDTGRFVDVLNRPHDHPLLVWSLWLLEDWAYPVGPIRAELEQQLFLAAVFGFSAAYTQELIADASSNFENRFIFLAQTLSRQADSYLTPLFPPASPFWRYQQTCWQETAEGRLAIPPWPPLGPDARPLAFTKIAPLAAALKAGPEDLLPQLNNLLDCFNRVLQILRDISTLKRDLDQNRFSYPILKTLQATGGEPNSRPAPAQLLGALVLSGTIETISQACRADLAAGQIMAETLKLPTFLAYLAQLEARVDEVSGLFSIKARPNAKADPAARQSFFVPYVAPLPKVIEMAQGYLLSDLSFRESWEIQRRGVFGTTEMTGKAFPMGLMAEILSQHGHDVARPINEVFDTLEASGFRYYDHPHLPPDADDLGLLLRLYHYSAQPERHQALLQTPLRWLEASIGAAGEIPVWLKVERDYPFLALWGQHCATVEANVLLGLLAFDPSGYQAMIEKSVRQWCERIIGQGLGANQHYTPLYALWTALVLVARVERLDALYERLQPQIGAAAQTLFERWVIEAERPHLSPQDAAFLTLAYLLFTQGSSELAAAAAANSVFNPNWLTLLCKTQRYDGSWAAEPLYGTPTRGEFATWYGSRPVTTAFCYHALKQIESKR